MPVPSEEQFEKTVRDFRKRWKFPRCIGCIDGKIANLNVQSIVGHGILIK
jgi:hypothetical protein